jgi:DNA polymerase-3 subunit chi
VDVEPTRAPRVDFYVLAEASGNGRLKLACRVTEKAYLAAQRVTVVCPDASELETLDTLLWTFAEGSFIPHERLASGTDCPVILCDRGPIPRTPDLIVNLGLEPPLGWEAVERIAEIVDGDAARRAAGRQRFKHYRSLGIEPQSHNVSS